jgi:hypothetical protein
LVVDAGAHGVVLDRRRRVTAGDRVLPRGQMDAASALASLENARGKLRDLLTAYDGVTIAADREAR